MKKCYFNIVREHLPGWIKDSRTHLAKKVIGQLQGAALRQSNPTPAQWLPEVLKAEFEETKTSSLSGPIVQDSKGMWAGGAQT